MILCLCSVVLCVFVCVFVRFSCLCDSVCSFLFVFLCFCVFPFYVSLCVCPVCAFVCFVRCVCACVFLVCAVCALFRFFFKKMVLLWCARACVFAWLRVLCVICCACLLFCVSLCAVV